MTLNVCRITSSCLQFPQLALHCAGCSRSKAWGWIQACHCANTSLSAGTKEGCQPFRGFLLCKPHSTPLSIMEDTSFSGAGFLACREGEERKVISWAELHSLAWLSPIHGFQPCTSPCTQRCMLMLKVLWLISARLLEHFVSALLLSCRDSLCLLEPWRHRLWEPVPHPLFRGSLLHIRQLLGVPCGILVRKLFFLMISCTVRS